ncbi:hypothetical protein Tco_1376339 [Tanacetum coccineum]
MKWVEDAYEAGVVSDQWVGSYTRASKRGDSLHIRRKEPLDLSWGRTSRLDSGARRRASFCGLIPLRSGNFQNLSYVGLVYAVTTHWMRTVIQLFGMTKRVEMDLFVFIRHSDPTKVRVRRRNLAKHEMFGEGSDADQEHLAEKDDDILEEVFALDASEVVAEKAKKKRKRKVTEDASAGFAIPSDATRPLVTASVTPILDVGPVDSVSGLNLWTRPSYVRYVVSSDSSHHSSSYSEAVSLVRSLVNALRRMFLSLDIETMHRVYVPRWKVTNDSVLDDPYVCRDMTDRLAPPALFTQLRAMDYNQLYYEFNVGAARQLCLGAEVRMRAEHTLERKCELEDKCVKQTTLLSEKDTEIAHLKSLLSLKEAEAAEAISLRCQLSEVEVADVAKSTELRDLKEKNFALEGERNVAKLTADLSGFQLSRDELDLKVASLESERDCLATQKSSLESAFELFKEQVEKMQDEQVGVLSERVAAIDSDLMEMVLHMDAEFYPRYLTTIAGWRWILSRGLKLVLVKCLSSPEYLSALGEAIGCSIDKGNQKKRDDEFTEAENIKELADIQSINILSQGLPRHIFNTLNKTETLVLKVGMPISTRITASAPYVNENGVSLILDLIMTLDWDVYEGKEWRILRFFTPVFKWVIPELFSIVRYYFSWKTKSAQHIVLYKLFNLDSYYGCHRFCFYPFGKVIHRHYQELDLAGAFQKRFGYVNSPLVKWPRRCDGRHIFLHCGVQLLPSSFPPGGFLPVRFRIRLKSSKCALLLLLR